jgi:hypothetical protein
MKTGTMTALLVLGMLAATTNALACPVDDAKAVLYCAVSVVHTDGEVTFGGPGAPVQQTYVNTHEPCLN